MPASETTTSNGYEIKRPTDKMDAMAYRDIITKFGLDGESPEQRIQQLKQLSGARLAVLLTNINKSLQGSKDHLLHKEGAMRIGEQPTIAPEARYDVFMKLIDDIKASPNEVNSERVADVLAMGIVLLHPFHDGNGRTARVVAMTFREGFDNPSEYTDDFDALAESRDDVRTRGGFRINGYTPRFPDGFDQSDPTQVSEYLHRLLSDESEDAYTGPYGQASLYTAEQ